MSLRRTSLSREKAVFSGISRALFRRDCSSEQAMDEPIGSAAAAVADQALAINPVAPASSILDAIIIAQPRRRGLAPPFGRDPLGPFGAGDVMHRAPPYEPTRHAFGRRVNHVDRLGPVEQALRPFSPLDVEGRGTAEGGGGAPPSRFARHLPCKCRGGD